MTTRYDETSRGAENVEPTHLDSYLKTILYRLDLLRRTLSEKEWKIFCNTETVHFPVHQLLLRDPFTRRAFEKPRGYAGDAVMLDYLYGFQSPPDYQTDPIGAEVFRFTTGSDPARAVRYRRSFLAQLIDEQLHATAAPISILTIAASHARELDLARAYQRSMIKRLVAYDQDAMNLSVVKDQYRHAPVSPMQGRINELIKRPPAWGKFDLIYAAGLFNYLPSRTAQRLIGGMFQSLNQGGCLMISNFRQEIPNTIYRTYMEAFMQWFLIYRRDEEVVELFGQLNEMDSQSFSLSSDPFGNIAFATVHKS